MIIQALFPRSCCACGRGPWPFCRSCFAELHPLGVGRSCERCWAPVLPGNGCRDCPPEGLSMARSAFLFDGPARAAVLRLKFGGEGSVARALGRAMSALGEDLRPLDAITWVPLSRKRLASRGYDQARLLARQVAGQMGIPSRKLLVRVRDIPPQAKSGRTQRMAAVEGLFVARCAVPDSVLLVDDVLTTGATAAECARVLAHAGARRVVLLTAARALLTGPRGSGGPVLSSVRFQSGSVVARGASPR